MKQYLLIAMCLLCSSTWVQAQEIKGRVVDELNKPVAYANVVLQKSDTTFLIGTTTDNDGVFRLEKPAHAKLLCISYIGYLTIYKDVTDSNDMGTISMTQDTQLLGEVVISGSKPIIKREIDRIVFNVANSPVAQGNNIMDLLRQTPLVKVTDNSIGIIGKSGAKIMINGKVSYLGSTDLVQYLKTLQSDDVSSIEVITTPPSKYDAGGNAGLINIVTKKNAQIGWNGSAGLTYVQRSYAGESVNATINYGSSKSLFSVKVRQNKAKGTVDENYDIEKIEGSQSSATRRIDTFKNIGGNLIFDYKLSPASTIGAVYDFSYGENESDINDTYQYHSYNTLDSILTTKSLHEGKTIAHTLNLYYDLKIDTLGKKLGLAANYMHSAPDTEVNFTTLNEATNNKYIVREPNNIKYSIYTGEANLELPFPWLKVETGMKYSDITNNLDMQYYNKIDGDFVEHPGRSNEFDFREKTLAAYLSASKTLNKYFGIQAGLRYEHTFVKGVSPHSDLDDVKTDYGKFFPTVYLNYKPSSSHSFNLNYARRINRPYFRALNPFKWYTNPNNVDEGNPALRPSFADNFELSYVFKNKLSVLLYHQKENNAYGQILSVADDNTTHSTYKNIYDNRQTGVNLSYSLKLFTWWDMYVVGNYFYNKSDIHAEGYEAQNGHSCDFKINNTFSFDKEKRFQLYMNYAQYMPYRVGISSDKSFANFSVGLKCAFLDNNLVFSFYGNDIFKQDLLKREEVSATNKQTYHNYYDSRYFRVSLVYKWGNKKLKMQNKKISFDERNRI